MTTALCLNCGDLKFGAICPSPVCEVASTGNMELDIAFSDHHYTEESLADLGKVIKAIEAASDDHQERFWAFLQYVTENHPSILTVDLEPSMLERCQKLLASIAIPPVQITPVEY